MTKVEPLRRVVVTGGDAAFFHLIREQLRSIRRVRNERELAVVVLDGGLTAEQQGELTADYAARVVDPGWEYDGLPAHVRAKSHLKTQIGRAFLDRHAPEADLILWVDADAWIQDFHGVDLMFESAAAGNLAVVAEPSRYASQVMSVKWRAFGLAEIRSILYKNARKARIGEHLARRIGLRHTLNTGVFALRRDAPHWEAWRRWQGRVLRGGGRVFSSDQVSLGLAVYLDDLPFELLPEYCNYMGPWKISRDGASLVEFYTPNRRLSVVHMCAQPGQKAEPPSPIDIPVVGGGSIRTTVRQSAWEERSRHALEAECPIPPPTD